MAFWGVEVKPGKPYIHRYDDDQGRLHLSQATMGTGSSTKKSILQCSVGDKKPINLCSLVPEKLENCTLNLEFEEDEKVTFSVIGSHTIHLSGFFFGDTDNEDGDKPDRLKWHVIGSDSETGNYSDYGMEHEDEDDSIDEDDDDDFDMYSSSPVRKSGGKIQIVVKNGSGNSVLESEDEDGFPISSPGDEQDKCKDKNGLGKNLKRNISAVDPDGESLRRAGPTDPSVQIDTASPVNETKQNKKNKKKKIPDEEEMARETDSKNDVSKGANSGVLEQNVDREKEKEKKRNKKKKKLENATNAEQSTTDKSGSTTETEEKAEAKPFQVRTFPNGLLIEELTMGKPDGKKAAPGKKVSVRYIGKLKKNGKQFDANIGRAPFKFRLGVGEVIKGWDVGVNGMRVGDKRRLTIPPAMGYGARGAPGAIPPNAWLVFDVELVDVN